MKSSPNNSYHVFSTIVKTNTTYLFLYLKHPISWNASQWECLSLKAGDKAETWIKGLKKLSNNFILPDRATKSFHSTISMCPWQYLGEILSSHLYIYHTSHSSLNTKGVNVIPHIRAHRSVRRFGAASRGAVLIFLFLCR